MPHHLRPGESKSCFEVAAVILAAWLFLGCDLARGDGVLRTSLILVVCYRACSILDPGKDQQEQGLVALRGNFELKQFLNDLTYAYTSRRRILERGE